MDGLSSSADPKTAIMNEVRQQSAVLNARQLIEKVNEHCFDRCIPKPGTSISSGESTCISSCMEKYMAAWNVVSKTYVGRLQQAQAAGPGSITF